MRFHGNSNKNNKEHHLYAIHDVEEEDVFKYGISSKPIDEDGYSSRMREQVDFLNRAVGWFRFLRKFWCEAFRVGPKLASWKMNISKSIIKNMDAIRNSVLHQSLSSSNLLTQSFPYYPTKSYLCVFTK
jgi:hypothetical protein